jgi:hypothetical protein
LVLTQITRTTPLRWMILHLSQIFFTDARTFIAQLSAVSFQPSAKSLPGFARPDSPFDALRLLRAG